MLPGVDRPRKPLSTILRIRFSMRQVMLLIAWFCTLFAIGSQAGILWLIPYVLVSLVVHAVWTRDWSLFLYALVTSMFAALLLPAAQVPRITTRQDWCANNMRQISMALKAYHFDHGSFPPAYVADAQGKPMHSWRVLILKYLDRPDLYARYRFDEPWDGPNNRKLHKETVELYCCPSDQGPPTSTSYVAVVGPGTAWPRSRGSKLASFQDGAANTLMIVECMNSGIHWMEPRDLDAWQMPPTLNPKSGLGISAHHLDGINAVLADGSSCILPTDLSPNDLRALLTTSGGEQRSRVVP